MSHTEQLNFFATLARNNTNLFNEGRVIEIGSYDVNGTMRNAVKARYHKGVDLIPGPGVDEVVYGHEISEPDGSYDAALSAECFEHDIHWQETFANMIRLVRPGGLVAFSCGGRGRLEHGTTRTDPLHSPGTQSVGQDYYRNRRAQDFSKRLLIEAFDSYQFIYQTGNLDLYFAGRRRNTSAAPEATLLTTDEIRALQKASSRKKRVLTLPMRLTSAVIPEPHFQRIAIPYWETVNRIRR